MYNILIAVLMMLRSTPLVYYITACYLVYTFVGLNAILPIFLYTISLYVTPYPNRFATLLAIKFLLTYTHNEVSSLALADPKEPFIHCEDLKPKLKPGDMIQFNRNSFIE
jgi:hypothetical protein